MHWRLPNAVEQVSYLAIVLLLWSTTNAVQMVVLLWSTHAILVSNVACMKTVVLLLFIVVVLLYVVICNNIMVLYHVLLYTHI
jgi:hypothetical protein